MMAKQHDQTLNFVSPVVVVSFPLLIDAFAELQSLSYSQPNEKFPHSNVSAGLNADTLKDNVLKIE